MTTGRNGEQGDEFPRLWKEALDNEGLDSAERQVLEDLIAAEPEDEGDHDEDRGNRPPPCDGGGCPSCEEDG